MLVGLYITGAYWFTASTSFANPAVTIARMLTDSFSGIAPAIRAGLYRRAIDRNPAGGANFALAVQAELEFRRVTNCEAEHRPEKRPARATHSRLNRFSSVVGKFERAF